MITSAHDLERRARFGVAAMDAVCDDLSATFVCSHTWPAGARGTFANAGAASNDTETIARLEADIADAAARARPRDAERFTFTARFDRPLAGPGGARKTHHVTSQSDFSDFFVERQLHVLNTPESASIRLSDITVEKVQKNAPRHLRQVAGTQIGDPDETFRFRRFSAGVTVYVVDGILTPDHDEFRNLFDGRSRVHADGFRSQTATETFANDRVCSSGHGTHVASLAAGYGYGIAKNATIVSVGVQPGCGESGFASDLIEGLSWVYDHYTAQPEPRAPAVVTMSLLLPDGDTGAQVEREIADLIAAGVIVVAAAGNYGEDACQYVPARIPDVVTVAAMDEAMYDRWDYSNVGSCVDVWAPGENVLGAAPECAKCTAVFSGTSQATPIVAGLIAHMLETEPALNPRDVVDRIQLAAASFDGAPSDTSRYIAQFRETA